MKRIITIISALLLVLTLSQCKKKPVATDNGPEPVSIILDVNGGSKVDVTTATGEVKFEVGDKIYVAFDGEYVGTLIHDGSHFYGSVSATPNNDKPLYFYFLGNKTPHETLTNGITSLSVDITDQTSGKLPVISAAASTEPYEGAGTYTSTLLNKCALVKFDVTTLSSAVTCIRGLNNKVTITFNSDNIGTFDYGKVGEGSIRLPAGQGEKWAILLPQAVALGIGMEGSVYSLDLHYTGTHAYIDIIDENDYLTDGIEIDIDNEYDPKISDAFKVSDTKSVYFSRGNLQYIGSATVPYWRFAINQFDCFGVNGQGCADANVDRDLFGWGCTGYQDSDYHSMQTYYYPYTVNSDKPGRYGPTGKYDLSTSRLSDWGCLDIANGAGSAWRTMTRDEWEYLLYTRSTTSGYRFVKAIVNDINGLVLLPDNWNASNYSLPYINQASEKYNRTVIGRQAWEDIFDTNGAVFLPAAGYRSGVTLYQVQADGDYWTSNYGTEYSALDMCFTGSSIIANSVGRHGGRSVRLVCDVE